MRRAPHPIHLISSSLTLLPLLSFYSAENWDEFPNGRWGDSRSPAYGEFHGYLLPHIRDKDAALWGTPETIEDVCDLFRRFCLNDLVRSCRPCPVALLAALSG